MHDVNIYVYVKRRLSFECTKEILNLQLEGLAGIAIAGTRLLKLSAIIKGIYDVDGPKPVGGRRNATWV